MTSIGRRLLIAALALSFIGAPALAVNVGVYTLSARQITTALSSEAQSAITDLDGAVAETIEANFAYGSGGTSASAVAQTSCDSGVTWRDVVRFDFATSTRVAYANVSGLTAKAPASYSALNSEGVNDGFICPQLRAVLTTVGTYVNTTLTMRVSVR